MTDKEVMQAAFDCLLTFEKEDYFRWSKEDNACVVALRTALAQPELKPVAWMEIGNYINEENLWCERKVLSEYNNGRAMPLYTAPPKCEWVGLTDNEYEVMAEQYITNCYFDTLKYAKAIEAKLKEKNT